jgi:acyl-CoA synthetase (AMP-forming)/AMP-acid ligase II
MDSLFRFEQVVRSRALQGRHFDWVQWDLLERNHRLYGEREALVDSYLDTDAEGLRRRTWSEAYHEVNTLIFNLLEQGFPQGGTVVSHLPNVMESAYLDWATSKLRAKHLGLNVDLGRQETMGVLERVRPDVAVIVPEWHGRNFLDWYRDLSHRIPHMKIYVLGLGDGRWPEGMVSFRELMAASVWDRYQEADLHYLKTDPLAVHELLPTAGTTGVPKISQRTTVDWFHVHSVAIAERAEHSVYDSRVLIGPLSGGSGRLWGVHTPLFSAGKVVYLTEFDEERVFLLTHQEKLTIWAWNPALITRLVTHPGFQQANLSSLRKVSYSGAPLSQEVIDTLLSRGITSFNVYGTSEVGGCMSPILSRASREHLLTAAGIPFEGFDVPVVDDQGNRLPAGEIGEILIWNIHHGYLDAPEESLATYRDEVSGGRWDGYQRTGDLGIYDAEGYLYIVGRKKDMILRGAQNIFPKELEDVLSGHPKIRDIAIVGMPDAVLGQRVVAFIVAQSDEAVSLKDLTDYLAELGVAKFKWPEHLEILTEMPLGPGGKVKKDTLRQWALERAASAPPS